MHSDCRPLGLVLLLIGLASTGWVPVQGVLMNAMESAQVRVVRAIDHRLAACETETCPRLSTLKEAFLSEQCESIEPPIALFASMLTPWGRRHGASCAD